jgi:hypothetical protein
LLINRIELPEGKPEIIIDAVDVEELPITTPPLTTKIYLAVVPGLPANVYKFKLFVEAEMVVTIYAIFQMPPSFT